LYPVSAAYQQAIKSTTRTKAIKVTIDTAFEHFDLTDEDIVQGSAKHTTAVLSGDTFELGAAVAADFAVTLMNTDGRYNDVQFNGGLITVQDGTQLPNDDIEWVPLGYFIIDQVSRPTSIVSLDSADYMLLFDRPFSDVGVTFPATNLQILLAICNKCGVILSTTQFINSDYTVITALDGNPSCRDVIEYIAEMAASFARINRYGQLELAWFNNPQYITEAHVFGGTFAKNAAGKYYDGDNISGGDFQKYNNKMYFGGVFKSNAPVVSLNPSNRYDFSIDDDPIIITGVEFDAQDQNYLVGSDTYAIKITDNPFIQGDPTDVLNAIADRLIGFAYLPYSSNWQGNPALDAGDMIEQTDRNGITYRTIITNSSYAYRGTCKIQAKGASVVTQGYQSPMTKKVTQLLRQISQKQVQLDSLQQAILNATNLIAGALGGYSIQGTGQYEGNFFIADNPDVTLAAKVWRWNLGGFGYSSTGVEGPFTTAITADGSIVANLLTAGIVTADLIKAGLLQSQEGSTWIDLDTGSFSFGNGALTYDTVNGFNCIAAQRMSMPGYPGYYAIIGKGPNPGDALGMFLVDEYNVGRSPFFKVWLDSDKNVVIQKVTSGDMNFVDENGNTMTYLDIIKGLCICGNGFEIALGVNSSGSLTVQGASTFSGTSAEGLVFQNGMFISSHPSTVSGTITYAAGHTITVDHGTITNFT
jgi:hypothetical protein